MSCVDGTLENKQHRVLLSTNIGNKDKLANLNISAKLANKIVTNFKK